MEAPHTAGVSALASFPRFSSRRPFLFIVAFLVVGILAGEWVWRGGLPVVAAVAVFVVLAGLLAVVAPRRLAVAVVAALVTWLGVVAVNVHRASSLRGDSLSALVAPGEVCRVEGIVLDEPEGGKAKEVFGKRDYRRYRFALRVTGVGSGAQTRPATGTVMVTVSREGELELGYGDRVALWGTVDVPDAARNPGGFNYRAYLDRKGIFRVIRVGKGGEVKRLGGGGSRIWKLIYAARGRLERSIEYGRMSDDSRAFLKAVLLGKRGAVSEALEDALVDTNTVHILAISGLHAAIIALVIQRALQVCFLPRWAASALTLVVLAFYAAMTGGRAPVVRASVMMAVWLAAPLVRREADTLNSIAFAAVIVLLIRPLEVFSAGFQLSFMTVGVIVLLAPRMIEWFSERLHLRPERDVEVPRWRRVLNPSARGVVGLFAVSVSAYVAAAPLTAYYFNRFAPLSFIPNVAVVALMGLIVPIGLFAAVVGQASSVVAAGLNTINGLLIGALQQIAVLTSNIRFIHVNVRSAPALMLTAYYGVLVAVGFAHRASRTVRVALAAALAVLGAVVLWSPAPGGPRGTEIVVLDVGKGDSIFVRTREGRRILIDGGMVLGGDPGRFVVMPFLRSRGYNRLDAVVLTHYDADHYGGLAHVIEHIEVGEFVVRGGPESRKADAVRKIMRLVKARGIPVVRLERGERLTPPGDTPVVALAPEASFPGTISENNVSIVLQVGDGPKALLTADIEKATERWLVETQAARLRASVLKVPHHGSKNASTPEFIEAARPTLAIATADRFGIHQHPAPAVVKRYESRGVRLLRTDEHGAVIVLLTADGLRAWTMLRPSER